MHKTVVRNYVLFVFITVICSVFLVYVLNKNYNALDSAETLLSRSHEVIADLEQLNSNILGLLGAQRGYILTPENDGFLNEYEELKADTDFAVKALKTALEDNTEATVKLTLIEERIKEFTTLLDTRLEKIKTEESTRTQILTDVSEVNKIKESLLSLSKDIFNAQYRLLNKRILDLERKQETYFSSLIIGIITTAVLLILFNWFLLVAQRKRYSAEDSLENTKSRLKHAFEATQDGIFDWNIEKGEIYFSGQYFKILGDNEGERIGDFDTFKNLVHPEDFENTLNKINLYLEGGLSELDLNFRMKHKNGRWVWIQSRAKGIRDEKTGKIKRIVGAHMNISYQKEYEAQILREKERAEQANQAKSEFLAHMSHEIRTPLTAISGIGEILEKQKDSLDDRQIKLIRTLNSSTSSLQHLVNDVLDFSRIESGQVDIMNEEFNLVHLMEEIISMMSVKAGEKNIGFHVDYDNLKQEGFIGDEARIRQVLVNLIGNAIKFTKKGEVKVVLSQTDTEEGAMIGFKVIDTGIGIDSDKFETIFERFKQEDGSVNRSYGGTGLGLPISKNLAELMNGTIEVESKKGKGSTFTLNIPLVNKAVDKDSKKSNRIINKINDKIRAASNGKSRILVVEDYEANVIVLSYLLEELGVEYDVANNGLEALDYFQEKHFDAILMDVQMPEMDGFAATKKIREIENENNLQATPIIGMTAHAFVSDRDQCIAVGMNSYLPKPIVEKDFKRELLSFLTDENASYMEGSG